MFLVNSWENVAIFIFGMLVAAWIAAFLTFKAARWVLAGKHSAIARRDWTVVRLLQQTAVVVEQ